MIAFVIAGADVIGFFEHAVKMLYIAVAYPVADFIHLQVRGVHVALGFFQADACQVGAEGHAGFFGEFGAEVFFVETHKVGRSLGSYPGWRNCPP